MEQFIADLAPAIASLALAVLGLVFIRVESYIRTKVNNEKAQAAMLSINDMVKTVVADVGATSVKKVRAAAADGVITANEAQALKSEAILRIKTLIPAQSTKIAAKVIADLDVYINSKIEEEVAAGK